MQCAAIKKLDDEDTKNKGRRAVAVHATCTQAEAR